MPAILEEAFISPFDRVMNEPAHVTCGGGSAFQQNYRIADVEGEANDLKNMYQPLHYQTEHNCDILIDKMMSCRVCRKKLIALLKEEQGQEQAQAGGTSVPSPAFPLAFDIFEPNSFLVNFMIGIALIFLMDSIIKLRLR